MRTTKTTTACTSVQSGHIHCNSHCLNSYMSYIQNTKTSLVVEEAVWGLHGLISFNAWGSPCEKDIWAATWQNQQNDRAPSEDSDQPGHPPSLIRVFAVSMKKPWVISYLLSTHQRLCSDWADVQADLSLRWAHTHFVGFVMSLLIYHIGKQLIHAVSPEPLLYAHTVYKTPEKASDKWPRL